MPASCEDDDAGALGETFRWAEARMIAISQAHDLFLHLQQGNLPDRWLLWVA
jgi:hypothetical protein